MREGRAGNVKTYMGLDLSLTKTGICVVRDGQDVFTTSVKTDSGMEWIERIDRILSTILAAIRDYQVDEILIENYAYNSRNGREDLAELHGVLMFTFEKMSMPYAKVAPTKVKLFGCGRGKAPPCPEGESKSSWPKKWVVLTVNETYGKAFKLSENDECDAFLIALMAEAIDKVRTGQEEISRLPIHQQRALADILGIKLSKQSRRKKDGSK